MDGQDPLAYRPGIARTCPQVLEAVKSTVNTMLSYLYLEYVGGLPLLGVEPPNPNALDLSLSAAADAKLDLEDRFSMRPLGDDRIVAILSEPLRSANVPDLLAVEAISLSVAANCLSCYDPQTFICFMTLWSVAMFRLGAVAAAYDVLVLLDIFGNASRAELRDTLELSHDITLRKAAQGRGLFGKNVTRVYSHTFEREVYV
jgi:hypothetical protein